MIQRITIENFKSIGKVSVELLPATVLIGRSGVGKSNFLRAIRFLRNYLLQPEMALNLEGGWRRIWPFGTPAPLTFSVDFKLPGFADQFQYEISLKPHVANSSSVSIHLEQLALGGSLIFRREFNSWIRWPGEGNPPQPESRVYLNLFPTVSEAVLAYTAWTTGVGWHDFPANVFSGVSAAAQSQPGGLDDTASNYLKVIRLITQDLRDQRARRQIVARIKQINSSVNSLELDSILEPKHVVVGHQVADRKIALDLSQESDGFRRYYAHLLALYQSPPKQVLMFEEPENGIYPGGASQPRRRVWCRPCSGEGPGSAHNTESGSARRFFA